jgi:hypothetical protein
MTAVIRLKPATLLLQPTPEFLTGHVELRYNTSVDK